MERQAPFASPNIDPYALAQVHQIAMQRMQQNGGMINFSGRPDSFGTEQEHANFPLKAEGQCQWDKNAPGLPNPLMSQPYNKDQGGHAAQYPYGGQMPDPQVNLGKQTNKEPKPHAHEQNMEIGYEDKPPSFESLEQRFLDEIMILEKEQCDAEDAENARRRERIIKINAQYQEKLSSLRAQQAKRREEFLLKEEQAQLYQYKQATSNHYPYTSSNPRGYVLPNTSPVDPRGCGPTNAGPVDPRPHGSTYASQIDPYDPLDPCGYGPTNEPHSSIDPLQGPTNDPLGYVGAAAMETRRAYAPGEFKSSKERIPFVGGGKNQLPQEKVPIPEGRVYNNINR